MWPTTNDSMMDDEYLADCPSIESNEDAYKEKTRIAEVAAATLCRLNSIMKQMKDWRDDRVKLRSNIWRLKLALRVVSRETDESLHADPLIEHQKIEIKRLEGANQGLKKELANIKTALLDGGYIRQGIGWKSEGKLVEVQQDYLVERERLKNEIQYLKSRLNETDEGHEHGTEIEHLKCKLKHFMMVDHTMEIIFTDIVNKVAETIANLSEELVNMNDRFHRSQIKNDNLYVEIDKLKAMLRCKSGTVMDYRKRLDELDLLTKRLKSEVNSFKDTRGDRNKTWTTDSNYQHDLKIIERLANELRNKLQNDHEALLAAGDPDCLKYMQKIVELRMILGQLHVELRKFTEDRCLRGPGKSFESNKFSKQLSILDTTLNEINVEIDKLKEDHVKKHCRIGGSDGMQYLNKVEQLETIVEKARTTLSGLTRRTDDALNAWKDIEKLERFVGKACQEIKQLEDILAASDSSIQLKKIKQMEELIVQLKTESNEKDENMNVLGQRLFHTETVLEQRTKDLNEAHRKLAASNEENNALKAKAVKMLELQREQEESKKELEQLQQVKQEVSLTKKKLQSLQTDKDALSKELLKIRNNLQRRNEEFRMVILEKETTEKSMNAKILDLMKNLQLSFKENEKLQCKINEHERSKSRSLAMGIDRQHEIAGKYSRERSKSMDNELQRLRTNLAQSMESLENANREIADLKTKLEHSYAENTKLEANVFQLESKKEDLVYQLGGEKTIAETRLKELAQLRADYNQVDVDRINLKKEREQLTTELTNMRFDRDLLQKSVEHVRLKCSTLEDEIDKWRSEADNLRKENGKLKIEVQTLSDKLKEAREELNGAGDKVNQLQEENTRLESNLIGLSLTNADVEGQVQVLLAEKNELVARNIELDKEISELKDQLNEVQKTSERWSVELNELRTEHDKVLSQKVDLDNTLDVSQKTVDELKITNEELKTKLSELHSEFRIVENQLKIFETMNATLKRDKETLEHDYEDLLRKNISRLEQDRAIMCGESVFSDQSDRSIPKVVDASKQAKLDKSRTAEAREELKKLRAENELLRFEVLNLKSQWLETRKELTNTRDELQKHTMELTDEKSSETAVEPISDKLEIVHLYYKETNGFSSMGAVARVENTGVCPYDGQEAEIKKLFDIANKLKVENVALKMEVNSLRCNLMVNIAKDEKWSNELQDATEEIQALKEELTKLRDEKESLRVQLDAARTKLDLLESEKVALKSELYALRNVNTDLKQKISELSCDYQKLRDRNEECIVGTMKKIKRFTMNAENQDKSDGELNILLKKYISNEDILRSIEQRMNAKRT